MIDLSNKSVLVIDQGLFLSFALRMAEAGGFGKVWYYNDDRRRGRPSFQESNVGKGYSEIEVVQSPWAYLDRADVLAFPDVMDWEWQVYLRDKGRKVWGSGRGAELELYRVYAKKIMEAVGLPVGPYQVVMGTTALRAHLKTHPEKVVKISYLRGLMETRKHEKFWLSKPLLDWLDFKLGPLADSQEFIIEDVIETELEVGSDQYFVGRFPKLCLNGVERKDSAYVGLLQAYDELPEELLEVNEKLAPVLAESGHQNFFSTECRIAKDGTSYPVDLTNRQGSPSGEAQLAMWTNMPEIVYLGAHGELEEPEPAAKCVAQAMIFNRGNEDEWCGVQVPKEHRGDVRLYFAMRKGDEDYIIPQSNAFDEIGSIVTVGDTPKEAIERNKAIAEKLGGHICVKTEELDGALKEFEEMDKRGMNAEPIGA